MKHLSFLPSFPSSSSSASSSSSSSLAAVSLLLAVVILLDGSGVGQVMVVSAWPGGSAMYECCCPESSGCRKSCFMCRNIDFVCNCDLCSCYHDDNNAGGFNDIQSPYAEPAPKDTDLLSILLRNGAGRKGRNWRYGPGR